jgi:hypothetical protein
MTISGQKAPVWLTVMPKTKKLLTEDQSTKQVKWNPESTKKGEQAIRPVLLSL